MPLSEFDFDSRFSSTVTSRSSSSPGRTAVGSLSSSQPSPARKWSEGCALPNNEIRIENVWALDAVSPAKPERAAASSLMWKGCGWYFLANSMVSFFETKHGPAVRFLPTSASSKYKRVIDQPFKRIKLADCDVTMAFVLLSVSRSASGHFSDIARCPS